MTDYVLLMAERGLPDLVRFDASVGIHDRAERMMRWMREAAARPKGSANAN